MFGAKMRVKTESHLEFVKGFARDARGENLVQTFESVMVALVPADTFFDGEARFHGVLQGANAGKRWDGVHTKQSQNSTGKQRNSNGNCSTKTSNIKLRISKGDLLINTLLQQGGTSAIWDFNRFNGFSFVVCADKGY
jgi:hypothetical protein